MKAINLHIKTIDSGVKAIDFKFNFKTAAILFSSYMMILIVLVALYK